MAVVAESDQRAEELVRQGWSNVGRPMERRRLATELVNLALFAIVATAIGAGFDATRDWSVSQAVVLVAAFALATRVTFDVGAGYTSPVQLAFVPMLLLLPTPWVPVLVAVGWLAGTLPDVLARRTHPDRLITVPGNCWFAIGATLVLVLAGAQTPDWGDWPWYLLALVAQFGFDLGANTLREWIGQGIAPDLQLRMFGFIVAVDAMLSPLGLLAAFASATWQYAFLLLVPPAGLLVFYSRERNTRIQNALGLADAARERQELIASASHELVTPLGILLGLTDRMAPGRPFDDARREQVHAAMSRELVQLRQLVRQFVDYTRLKSDRELALDIQAVAVRPVLDEVASALATSGAVEVVGADDVMALADRDRLHQMVLTLTTTVLRAAPALPEAHVAVRAAGAGVDIVVSGGVPGAPSTFEEGEPAGIGLHVTRELALAQGGDVRADPTPEGGTRYTLTLPRPDPDR